MDEIVHKLFLLLWKSRRYSGVFRVEGCSDWDRKHQPKKMFSGVEINLKSIIFVTQHTQYSIQSQYSKSVRKRPN